MATRPTSQPNERRDPYHPSLFVFEEPATDGEHLPSPSAPSKFELCEEASSLHVRFQADAASRTSIGLGSKSLEASRKMFATPGSGKDSVGRRSCRVVGAATFTLVSLILALLLPYTQDPSFSIQLTNGTAYLTRPLRHLSVHLPGTHTSCRHACDALSHTIGRRDYAFAADGARIAPDLTAGTLHLSSKALSPHPAAVILRDNLHGGRCWSIPGKEGQVGIVAAERLHPTHITIDHVPRDVADDVGCAPRRMRAWAYVEGSQSEEKARQFQDSAPHPAGDGPRVKGPYNTFIHMIDFEFNIHAQHHIQTFAIDQRSRELDLSYGVFVVEVLDNWGSETTCIYRIRIHGRPSSTCELLS